MPFFTVLTCSYNRAKELSRLYQSLQRQTFEDFVWLVMDDSTTDGVEKSIREWQREGCIAIEYHRSEHRGKHWAQKDGFSLVHTPFVVDVDGYRLYLDGMDLASSQRELALEAQ